MTDGTILALEAEPVGGRWSADAVAGPTEAAPLAPIGMRKRVVGLAAPLALGGFLLAIPIMWLFGVEPAVARIGASYLQITMATVLVLVALFIGGGILRAVGDSRTPMRVTAIANVVNIVLAYGLIYGHWGLPALGTAGSAWATLLARGLALVLLLRTLVEGREHDYRIAG